MPGGTATHVINWLLRLFGIGTAGADPEPKAKPDTAAPAVVQAAPAPAARSAAAIAEHHRHDRAIPVLNEAQSAFLFGLNDPPEPMSLDDLSQDDRAFIAGIQRRLRTRELELPVIPEMAIRLSRMFRDGAPVTEFVKLLNRDASLSVEVLKTANSPFYASARPLTSLQEAILRIGLDRLQSVLMLAHMRGKVLKGGAFQAEADLLLELALPVGHLATKIARGHQKDPEMCFMRGALMHVEHLVILGTTAAVARDVRRTISPSPEALHQAFVRFGREIREAVAQKWNLVELLLGGEEETRVGEEYELIRKVLICRWLRLQIPPEASMFEGLQAAIADIHPRVPPRTELGPGEETSVPLAS